MSPGCPHGFEGDAPVRPPRVCVLSGGPSLEAHASRVSAGDVYDALVASNHEVLWLHLTDTGDSEIRATTALESAPRRGGTDSWQEAVTSAVDAAGVEVVFPVIHGSLGEDGQVQALCESLPVRYVGCDAAGSIVCYDKARFKNLARSAGLPVARCVTLERAAYEADPSHLCATIAQELGYPCILKPSQSGSSLGLSRVARPADLDAAIRTALVFDDVVLAEQFVAGCDVEIGVLEHETPVVGIPVELEYQGELYDYHAKYHGGDRRFLPARCPERLIARLRHAARDAFRAAGCRGMARVDLLVDSTTERFVVNEINTIPYMPESSTFAQSLCHATNRSYRQLVAGLVRDALGDAAATISPA